MERCLGCMEEYEKDVDICPHCGYQKGAPVKEAYHIPPGAILQGKYLMGRVLGYGGFGVTYIGYDLSLDQKLAIKEYLPSEFSTRMPGQTQVSVYSGDATEQFSAGLQSLLEEAQRLAKFNALAGVVAIYDSFLENNTAYIVMEFLDGRTVKEILQEEGPMSFDRAEEIVLAVLATLKVVHQSGIIHRDIAPDNIFITKSDDIKLLDFGASRYATMLHSKSLSVILKPGYAPEEQYRGRGNQGPWSDIYALGACFYKMLTGITPAESMERKSRDTLQEPSKLGAVLPQSAENAIMNALNVNQEDRIQSAEEFAAALLSENVTRNKIKQKREDAGLLPLWLKTGLGVLGGAVAVVSLLVAVGVIPLFNGDIMRIFSARALANNEIYTPNVLKMTLEEAESAAREKELMFQIKGKEYTDKVDMDLVMSQTPEANQPIALGDILYVVVSAGPEEEAKPQEGIMPDVSYKTVAEAEAEMQAAGIAYVLAEEESAMVAEGYVIRQDIAMDTPVPEGTMATITISLGNQEVKKKEQEIAVREAQAEQAKNQAAQTGAQTGAQGVTQTQETVKVTGVSMQSGLSLNVGETKTLSATVSPANAGDKGLRWASSNNSVISVDAGGRIIALKAGSVTITVTTTDGGHTASAVVTAVDPNAKAAVTGVRVTPASHTLTAGEAYTLRAEILPRDASEQRVLWISSNASVAEVDQQGRVTALKAGSAVITAVSAEGQNLRADCSITVKAKQVSVTSVKLSPSSNTLELHNSARLQATVLPSDATNKNIRWSTSDARIVQVDVDGVIIGMGKGTAAITATTEDGGHKASINITVKEVTVTGVSIAPTAHTIPVGEEYLFTATVTPDGAGNKKVTWKSSNNTVATVDSAGRIQARREGAATITVTTDEGNFSAVASLTVTTAAKPVTNVTVTPSALTLTAGDTQSLSVSLSPTDATDKSISYSSSNSAVVSVTAGGQVTAVKAGSARITVTANNILPDDSGFPVSAYCDVTVAEPSTQATSRPTTEPTSRLTTEPTSRLTTEPTSRPTTEPTSAPTTEPTSAPTTEPTSAPTTEPASEPERFDHADLDADAALRIDLDADA